MNFMELLHINLTNQKKQTENGAIGYQTTGKALVDLNFAVASLRNESETQIVKRFLPAFYEDRLLAVKWLFFLRDVRGGLGERRTFRILMKYLATSFPELTQYVRSIQKYSRKTAAIYGTYRKGIPKTACFLEGTPECYGSLYE